MTEAAFLTALDKAGLSTKDRIIADGRLHRFTVTGDSRSSKTGWYVLYQGEIWAGSFGCWKRGIKENWCSKTSRELTPQQRQQHRQRMEAIRANREAEEKQRHKEAAQKASSLWFDLCPAQSNHPYLLTKGVKSHGLRQQNDRLVIPLMDSEDTVYSLQFISPDGQKRFLKGGRKRGCFYPIGEPGETICIAEGYATSASIYEATGLYTAVAFDAGNLEPVAAAHRAAYPKAKIILCSDYDENRRGQEAANQAALAVNGYVTDITKTRTKQ